MQDDVISFKQGSSSFFMPFLWKISLLTTMLSDGWFNHFATTKPPERLSGCWAFSSRRWFIWGCWTMRWNAWKFHIAYQAIQTPALACSYSFPNPSSSSFTKPAPGTSRTSGGRKVQFPVGILSLANKEGNYICMLHSRKLAPENHRRPETRPRKGRIPNLSPAIQVLGMVFFSLTVLYLNKKAQNNNVIYNLYLYTYFIYLTQIEHEGSVCEF